MPFNRSWADYSDDEDHDSYGKDLIKDELKAELQRPEDSTWHMVFPKNRRRKPGSRSKNPQTEWYQRRKEYVFNIVQQNPRLNLSAIHAALLECESNSKQVPSIPYVHSILFGLLKDNRIRCEIKSSTNIEWL